ncbi:hypothetical protein ABIE45_006351 [Methylobacterium sp. OAE515]|uniref:hypothetical protein n=1 Tax=Methylobacterium sp. OAE515 TaxID=2817895 RepID=UPI001789BD1D
MVKLPGNVSGPIGGPKTPPEGAVTPPTISPRNYIQQFIKHLQSGTAAGQGQHFVSFFATVSNASQDGDGEVSVSCANGTFSLQGEKLVSAPLNFGALSFGEEIPSIDLDPKLAGIVITIALAGEDLVMSTNKLGSTKLAISSGGLLGAQQGGVLTAALPPHADLLTPAMAKYTVPKL